MSLQNKEKLLMEHLYTEKIVYIDINQFHDITYNFSCQDMSYHKLRNTNIKKVLTVSDIQDFRFIPYVLKIYCLN